MPASPALAGTSVSGLLGFYIGLRVSAASVDKVRLNGEGFGLLPRKSESNDALCPMCRVGGALKETELPMIVYSRAGRSGQTASVWGRLWRFSPITRKQ